jgi:hypothetical protein
MFIYDFDFSFMILIFPVLALISFVIWKGTSKEELFLFLIGISLIVIGGFLSQGLKTETSSQFYDRLLFSTPGFISWMFRIPGHFLALIVLVMRSIQVLLYVEL